MHPQLAMLGLRFLVWAASLSLPNDGASPANQKSAAWHNSIPEQRQHDTRHGFTPMNFWMTSPREKRAFENEKDAWPTDSFGWNGGDGSGSGGGGDTPFFARHSQSASQTKDSKSRTSLSHHTMKDELRKKLLASDTPWGSRSHDHCSDWNDRGHGKNDGNGGNPSGNDFTVPEPASLIVWSLLGTLGLVIAWRRK